MWCVVIRVNDFFWWETAMQQQAWPCLHSCPSAGCIVLLLHSAEKLTRKMERDFNAFNQSSKDMLNKSFNLEIWKKALSAPTSGKLSCEKASLKLILDPDSNWLWTLGNHWDWVLAVSAWGQRGQLTWTDRGHWTLNRAGEKIRQQGEVRINGL